MNERNVHVYENERIVTFVPAAAAATVKLSSSPGGAAAAGGKDLLKSAETDKFLAGFLGGV